MSWGNVARSRGNQMTKQDRLLEMMLQLLSNPGGGPGRSVSQQPKTAAKPAAWSVGKPGVSKCTSCFLMHHSPKCTTCRDANCLGKVVLFGTPGCPGKDKIHSRDRPKNPTPAAKPAPAPKRVGAPKPAPGPAAAPPAEAPASTEDTGPLARCLPRKELRQLSSYVDAVLANQAGVKSPSTQDGSAVDIDMDADNTAAPPVVSDQEAGLLASIAAVEALPVPAVDALAALQAQLSQLRSEQLKLAEAPARGLKSTIAQFEWETTRYLDIHVKKHNSDMETVAQKMRDAMKERQALLDTQAKALTHHAEQIAKLKLLEEKLANEQLDGDADPLEPPLDRAKQLEDALAATGCTKAQTATWPADALAALEIALHLPLAQATLKQDRVPVSTLMTAEPVTTAPTVLGKRQADTTLTKDTAAEMDDIVGTFWVDDPDNAICQGLGILSQPLH